MINMKYKLLLAACFVFATSLLSGCMMTSGTTEYSLEPLIVNGEAVCCKAHVYNTKDYQKLQFKFKKNADGSMTVTLDEDGVSASDPAAVAAQNNSKLLEAVTSLIPIVTQPSN
jgi:hypothetical protein